MSRNSRRSFLKTALISTGGILSTSLPLFSENNTAKELYAPRMIVNPDIDNLRVICGVNAAMIKGQPTSWEMISQNAPVNAEQVVRTLDAMALSLTRKENAPDAWKTIFRKPESKSWNNVKAAIKVNCIGKNHPRVAVVNKICIELNRLGVGYQNMFIYDGSHNATSLYTPFVGKGLPTGVIIGNKNNALGGTVKTPLSLKGSHPAYNCTRMITDGSIDILVNIAVNKNHDATLGGTTLTLKNHAGTFEPLPIHTGGGLDYILAFSKSEALWGGSPVRQQLCIVDSLWGSTKGGPFAIPDKQLDRLVMGTFSGAVDYLTAKKIREPLMGATHGPVERFIKDFGYEERELTGWESITL